MDQGLLDRLQHCQRLPSLSTVALRVIDIANDPAADLDGVALCIGNDPALATKVLRVANSPFYGNRRKCNTLRQAVTNLGLNNTICVALSFSLASSLEGPEHGFLDRSSLWQRSLVCAVAANLLADALNVKRPEELFLGGLLQDIGMLVLDAVMGERYGSLANDASHADLVRIEREGLGTDHVEVGVWMMNRWGLPDYLQDMVRFSHHAVTDTPQELTLTARCIRASNVVADLWLQGPNEDVVIRVADHCWQWLQIDADGLQKIVDLFPGELRSRAELLGKPSLTTAEAADVLDQAKEALLIRTLSQLAHAQDVKAGNELLEARTQALEAQACIDRLTGLFNRASLEDRLAEEFARADDGGHPLSVAFIDLDRFKQINDTHGHLVGDEVLQNVARVLAAQLRETDFIARYGGEEFVVVLPGLHSAEAQFVTDRLLQALRTCSEMSDTVKALRVTASIGLATYTPACGDCDDATAILRAADRALYSAKNRGRDNVVSYEKAC